MVFVMNKTLICSEAAVKPLNIYSFTSKKLFLFLYCALFFGLALGAYNIGFVPIEWLVRVGLIMAVLFLGFTQRLYIVPGSRVLLFFFFWALLVTALNSMFNDYAGMMPVLATTPYPVFISLRFLNILSFISALYLIWWLLVKGYKDSIIKWTVIIGFVFALFAVYIYIAQMYGLPELPRTRMSTGGNVDPNRLVRFSYAFHRATGTFREPSHLAEWLVIPFFLGMIYRKRSVNIYSIVIGGVILLTGSLTSIMGVLLGIVGTILVANPFRLKNMKVLCSLLIVGAVSLFVFNVIAMSYGSDRVNIVNVVIDRLEPIFFEGGMQQSSRSYIYKYLADTTLPLIGSGLGNSNIVFSDYLGASLPAAFLSSYFNALFSTGIVGLALVVCFLFTPFRQRQWRKKLKSERNILMLSACYFSWLIMAAVHSYIFSMSFAIIFCLIVYELRQNKQFKEVKRQCVF